MKATTTHWHYCREREIAAYYTYIVENIAITIGSVKNNGETRDRDGRKEIQN